MRTGVISLAYPRDQNANCPKTTKTTKKKILERHFLSCANQRNESKHGGSGEIDEGETAVCAGWFGGFIQVKLNFVRAFSRVNCLASYQYFICEEIKYSEPWTSTPSLCWLLADMPLIGRAYGFSERKITSSGIWNNLKHCSNFSVGNC